MHHCGGIYADMDYYCYQDFHSELADSACVVENPYGNDPIENSLMASVPGHDFWTHCMELSLQRYQQVKHKRPDLLENIKVISADRRYGLKLRPYLVFYVTGTNLISSAYRAHGRSTQVGTLCALYYNNCDISYDPAYRARHIHTGLWGRENHQLTELLAAEYQSLRNIPVESFDFYHDYSGGRYLRDPDSYQLDFDKNDTETQLFSLSAKHDYT